MAPRPFKTICISLYLEDDARLVELVKKLQRRGVSGANKSKVVRWALEQVDLDAIVKNNT